MAVVLALGLLCVNSPLASLNVWCRQGQTDIPSSRSLTLVQASYSCHYLHRSSNLWVDYRRRHCLSHLRYAAFKSRLCPMLPISISGKVPVIDGAICLCYQTQLLTLLRTCPTTVRWPSVLVGAISFNLSVVEKID